MKLIMKVKYEMLCVAFTDGHKREERVRFRHATARREGGGCEDPRRSRGFWPRISPQIESEVISDQFNKH
jgi:hypothetical protein